MRYPREFVEAVKQHFPKWEGMHHKLDIGDQFVGRYLDDNRMLDIGPTEIVEMIDNGQINELRERAASFARTGELYRWWLSLAEEQRKR